MYYDLLRRNIRCVQCLAISGRVICYFGHLLMQKLLDVKMASFKVNLLCVWSKEGIFERLDTSEFTAQKDSTVGL